MRAVRDLGQAVTGECCLIVRPEYVMLGPNARGSANSYRAKVLEVIHLGDIVKYRLALESGDQLFAKAMAVGEPGVARAGGEIVVGWHGSDCLLLTE